MILMKKDVTRWKVKGAWFDEAVDREFRIFVISRFSKLGNFRGEYREALRAAQLEFMRNYGVSHAHKPAKISIQTKSVLVFILQFLAARKKDTVSKKELDEWIEDNIGDDRRTLQKYQRILRERNFIGFVQKKNYAGDNVGIDGTIYSVNLAEIGRKLEAMKEK